MSTKLRAPCKGMESATTESPSSTANDGTRTLPRISASRPTGSPTGTGESRTSMTVRGGSPGVRGAERADLISAGLIHLSHDVDLVRPNVRHRDVEMRGPVAKTRVDSAEPRAQDAAQLVECEIRHEHLPDLGNEHKPFPGHLQRIRELDLAGEYQH